MILKTRITNLTLLALISTIFSCSDDQGNNSTEITTTSLFNEVIEPEIDFMNSGDSDMDSVEFTDDILADESIAFEDSVPIVDGRDSNTIFDSGVLTAGEWNDLNNWDFWKNLLNNEIYSAGISEWNLTEINRYSFQVRDNTGSFVANAEISLTVNQTEIWKTKTDNRGEATLWSGLDFEELSATISIKDNVENVPNVIEFSQGINEVSLNTAIANEKIMDIYFAIDATGSMGDEINFLKAELSNVIESVKQQNPVLQMRFGSVFYRDEGDEYLTRDLGFTTDETSLVSFINEQSASGGGDFPEAVHTALDVAITQNTWDSTASSRLLFLLLDAPPHKTQEVVNDLERNLIKAAQDGIKIIPISASGIDKSTEYLMRSFSILTNGTYVFITDDSGVGNSHIEPTVGEYEVQKLNDLLINLIDQYIPE